MRVHFVFWLCISALLGGPALAENRLRLTGVPRIAPPAGAALMPAYAVTSTPFGWADFCSRPESKPDCDVPLLAARAVVMDARRWRSAGQINRFVNDAVQPMSDLENYGVEEYWGYPDNGRGDCEDYVLLKRRMLMQAGFPRQALLITVVRDEADEGHAVLTLRTTGGDYILDNKNDELKPWDRAPYRFVKRQSEENPNIWVSLRARAAPPVAAALTAASEK